MRTIISFYENWLFAKTKEVPSSLPEGWQKITLPHTWNAQDGQDGGNDYWRGTACYAKSFVKPSMPENGCLFLEINGAANIAHVYLNGQHLACHEGGYSTFRVNLTDALVDENLLCITVDNSENDYVYPQKADFTFYGGLYRSVNLIVTPAAHFDLETDGTPGVRVTPKVDLENKRAEVAVTAWVNGEADRVRFVLGDTEQQAKVLDGMAETVFVLQDVHLWDGVNDPYLYTVTAALENGDEVSARFGCRTFDFDPEQGFMLNGRVYPLRGVSRHQDRWQLGNALTIKEHREDMELIREIGANTIRLAHYQHAQEFYDLCDAYGMVVWAEIPYITEHMPKGRKNTLDQMRELVTQCYNHPSIVCWGLSNEVAVHGVSPDLMENHVLLNELCHKMDITRPTTMAHAFMLEQNSPLIKVADIGSYNLYFGWYMGTLEQNDSFFDEYHEKYPTRIMGFSEYGADCNVQFQTAKPQQGDYSEQYQCVYHEYIMDCIARHPWMWATHVWNMFDFAADGRDEGGAHGLNQKGLVSFDRALKKDAFYLYKAEWNKTEPFVHLCGRRYIERPESETEICVYSNQPSVTLFVDDREPITQTGKRKFVFRIPISGQHTITATAGDSIDTMQIHKVDTANAAYTLGRKGAVANWFDEAEFDSSCWSIRDSFGALMAHPEAGPIVGALMEKIIASRGDVAKTANQNPNLQKMLAGMSFQALLKQAGDAVAPEVSRELNARLQKIPK